MSVVCLFRRHDWRSFDWGGWFARECGRCERFDVWAYGSFHTVAPVRRMAVEDLRRRLISDREPGS